METFFVRRLPEAARDMGLLRRRYGDRLAWVGCGGVNGWARVGFVFVLTPRTVTFLRTLRGIRDLVRGGLSG